MAGDAVEAIVRQESIVRIKPIKQASLSPATAPRPAACTKKSRHRLSLAKHMTTGRHYRVTR